MHAMRMHAKALRKSEPSVRDAKRGTSGVRKLAACEQKRTQKRGQHAKAKLSGSVQRTVSALDCAARMHIKVRCDAHQIVSLACTES